MKKRNKILIDSLLEEIEKDLEYINIHELIEKSGFSYFHFHRIFQAYLGESLKQYVKRRRLEVSAHKLNYRNMSITKIAFEAGYLTSSSFNKAFKVFFNTSPSKYKNTIKQEYEVINPEEIKEFEEIKIYSISHKGSYLKLAKKFEKIMEFCFNNSFKQDDIRVFGIYYDNPSVTQEDKLRSRACISYSKEVKNLDEDIEVSNISAGKYAVFVHNGAYSSLALTYERIFASYVKEKDIELRNEPIFEEYLNSPYNVEEKDLKTLIYLPVV